MHAGPAFDPLLEYTEWERRKWLDWLRQCGQPALQLSAGSHGDGRFENVGDLVRHTFSAEKRYVDRLSGRPITDTAAIPTDDAEALFQFGRQSRQDLRDFIQAGPPQGWDTPTELKLLSIFVSATPRKIVMHVLLHEIRHWAQIATILRWNGLTGDFHDFLFSPVLGGEVRREA